MSSATNCSTQTYKYPLFLPLSMHPQKTPKFIVVTGGVLSGLGKGIASASMGNLLSHQYRVIPVKCDGYLNGTNVVINCRVFASNQNNFFL